VTVGEGVLEIVDDLIAGQPGRTILADPCSAPAAAVIQKFAQSSADPEVFI
jgi:hypothetical protein